MAVLRAKEIKNLSREEAMKRLREIKLELMKERAQARIGGAVKNPGRIRELRRTIARIYTIFGRE